MPDKGSNVSAAFPTVPKLFIVHPQDWKDPGLEGSSVPAEAGAGPGQSQTQQAHAKPSLSWWKPQCWRVVTWSQHPGYFMCQWAKFTCTRMAQQQGTPSLVSSQITLWSTANEGLASPGGNAPLGHSQRKLRGKNKVKKWKPNNNNNKKGTRSWSLLPPTQNEKATSFTRLPTWRPHKNPTSHR